jgi:hypothetical protein
VEYNKENGKIKQDKGINSLVMDNKLVMSQNKTTDAFNKHVLLLLILLYQILKNIQVKV